MKKLYVKRGPRGARSLVLACCLGAVLALSTGLVHAQTWTNYGSPTNGWTGIACSADGTRLIASAKLGLGSPMSTIGHVYISTNSGVDWLETTNAGTDWGAVASSADGSVLLASQAGNPFTPGGGQVYLSADSGVSWSATSLPRRTNWVALSASADGTRLAAAWHNNTINGRVYVSQDSGATWNLTSLSNANWNSLACSADGSTLAAAANGGTIFLSRDAGLTWNPTSAPATNWSALACSADAKRILAAAVHPTLGGGPLYISGDSGATWQASPAPTMFPWSGLGSSADGARLVAVAGDGPVLSGAAYRSTNSGASWQPMSGPSRNWAAVCTSADGCFVAGAVQGGLILVSRLAPQPVLNIANAPGNVQLSWTVPSMNFVLQQNSDLTTTSWADVNLSPTLNYTNVRFELTIPVSPGVGFYRLQGR